MTDDAKKLMRFQNLMFDELGRINLGPLIDSIDLKILARMSLDCRMSYAELSREVNLSRMAVRARVLKMIESGLIERFSVIVSHRKLGLLTSVYLEVTCSPGELDNVGRILALNPKIESIYVTTGSPILHTHAFLENFNALEEFIFKEIFPIDGIVNVDYRIMTKKYKDIRLFT